VKLFCYPLGIRGSILVMARDFCLLQSVQMGSQAHPVSYSLGNRASFPAVKAGGARLRISGSIFPLPIHPYCVDKENFALTLLRHLHSSLFSTEFRTDTHHFTLYYWFTAPSWTLKHIYIFKLLKPVLIRSVLLTTRRVLSNFYSVIT